MQRRSDNGECEVRRAGTWWTYLNRSAHALLLTCFLVPVFAVHDPTVFAACGNGVVETGEDCDTGGWCRGGSLSGQRCTSEADCGTAGELGVCVGGYRQNVACSSTAACTGGGKCRRCVPAGHSAIIGDRIHTCAANCTFETKIRSPLDPASKTEMSSDKYDEMLGGPLALPLAGAEEVLVGKERDGEIPVAVVAGSVYDPISIGTIACACVLGVPIQTCGGTMFEADGMTPALDCTDGYTAGASVCTDAGKPPCTFVNGLGNSAAGVISCDGGLNGVDLLVSEDSKGSADPPVCDASSPHHNPPTPPYPACGDPPVVTLSGTGGPGSAIVTNAIAIGQFVGGDCSAAPAGFCSNSAPIWDRGQPQMMFAVTGTAAAEITNANQKDNNTICDCRNTICVSVYGVARPCLPEECAGPIAITGSPAASCSQVAAGSLSGLGLAGAYTLLSPDIVVTHLQKLRGQACVGDCNGDHRVTVDELLTGVEIALGAATFDQCRAFDADGDRTITIDELLEGANNALNACPSS